MRVFIVCLRRIVSIRGETQVWVSPVPDLQLRSPGSDNDPHTNVKLTLLDDQGRLDVFLCNPDLVHARPNVVYQVVLASVDLNASPARLAAGLDDPGVATAV